MHKCTGVYLTHQPTGQGAFDLWVHQLRADTQRPSTTRRGVHGCVGLTCSPVPWCVGASAPWVPGAPGVRVVRGCAGTRAHRDLLRGHTQFRGARVRGHSLHGGLTSPSPLSPDGSTPTPSSPAWPPSWPTTPGHGGAASAAWPPDDATPATRSGTPAAGPAPGRGRAPGPPPPPSGCSTSGDRPGPPPRARLSPDTPEL